MSSSPSDDLFSNSNNVHVWSCCLRPWLPENASRIPSELNAPPGFKGQGEICVFWAACEAHAMVVGRVHGGTAFDEWRSVATTNPKPQTVQKGVGRRQGWMGGASATTHLPEPRVRKEYSARSRAQKMCYTCFQHARVQCLVWKEGRQELHLRSALSSVTRLGCLHEKCVQTAKRQTECHPSDSGGERAGQSKSSLPSGPVFKFVPSQSQTVMFLIP